MMLDLSSRGQRIRYWLLLLLIGVVVMLPLIVLVYLVYRFWGWIGVFGVMFVLAAVLVYVKVIVSANTMKTEPRLRWQRIRRWLFFLLIGVVVMLVAYAIYAVIVFGWGWTGFVGSYSKETVKSATVEKEYLASKTLWDWMQLLLVPVMLAGGVFVLNLFQKRREERITKERDRTERWIAQDNQREAVLQDYISKIGELLLRDQSYLGCEESTVTAFIKCVRSTNADQDLTSRLQELDRLVTAFKVFSVPPQVKSVENIAQARTVTTLRILDPDRRASLLRFLDKAGILVLCIKWDLSELDLQGANLSRINLSWINLRRADLRRADLRKAELSYADLRGADLRDAHLDEADLRRADLSEADLRNAHLDRVDLSRAVLSEVDLRNAHLDRVDLSRAVLYGDRHRPGPALQGACLSTANLNGVVLRSMDLEGARFRHAQLRGADLSRANLNDAELQGADLSGANLQGAQLSGADLSRANLSDANLQGARLRGFGLLGFLLTLFRVRVPFFNADLSDANLRGVDLSKIDLHRINLRRAEGLTNEQWADYRARGALVDPDPPASPFQAAV